MSSVEYSVVVGACISMLSRLSIHVDAGHALSILFMEECSHDGPRLGGFGDIVPVVIILLEEDVGLSEKEDTVGDHLFLCVGVLSQYSHLLALFET